VECLWAARAAAPAPTTPPTANAAEMACREQERACKESVRLNPENLPEAPKCPPAPPPCNEAEPAEPEPVPDALEYQLHFECERAKRECLVAANCDADLRAACTSAFHACEEPVRAERKRVHELCHAERETCDAAATDEAGHHACHVAEHRCKLPVEPPEAVCHIDALECLWAAQSAHDVAAAPDSEMPPGPSAGELACRETERACKDSMRLRPDDLPEPPHCPRVPPACAPEASP